MFKPIGTGNDNWFPGKYENSASESQRECGYLEDLNFSMLNPMVGTISWHWACKKRDINLDICKYKDGFSSSTRFFSCLKYATKEMTKLNIIISVIGTHKNIRFTCQLWIGITFMCKFTFCFIKQGKFSQVVKKVTLGSCVELLNHCIHNFY